MVNWSFARFDLGLSPAEFFSMTPRQLAALRKRWERKSELDEFMAAQNAYYTVAFSMCRPKELPSIADFMPSKRSAESANTSTQRMNKTKRKLIAAKLRTLVKIHA